MSWYMFALAAALIVGVAAEKGLGRGYVMGPAFWLLFCAGHWMGAYKW